ncbi:MAG: phosphoribosyltransferase [Methanoregulaceae archaeon]|nr:phosphoribosyltransferase [Methanoregulaceae archaeon]
MGKIYEEKTLRNRTMVFADRDDAGERLARFIRETLNLQNPLVCAIPAGGVPAGVRIARSLDARMMLGIVRKVRIPWNPEAGFGAVTWDGRVFLNEALVRGTGLSQDAVERAIRESREEIRQRQIKFPGNEPSPAIKGSTVIVTDDGLASGYTMRAAIEAVRSDAPEGIIAAVPTGSARAVSMIGKIVECVMCLNIREGHSFAVADAYRHWHDLSDAEVLQYLEAAQEMGRF